MSRRRLIVGNWKMHRTASEAAALIGDLLPRLAGTAASIDVAIAPAFTALAASRAALEGGWVALAAQNAHWEEEGPFTGEVSAPMLKEAGCAYVIVGHSERREHFSETDRRVNRKLRAVLFRGMTPILCVGEKADERASGRELEVVDRQLKLALAGVRLHEENDLVIAYEPVWAIGTGRNASPADASEVHGRIRHELSLTFGPERAGAIRILYGGSVNRKNAAAFLAAPDIDGLLVGGASLDAESFAAICAEAAPRP